MHLAFVTDRERADFAPDDRLLASYVTQKGVKVSATVWDNAGINWEQFDAIIFRSVWDYFVHRQRFDDWLRQMTSVSVPIFNSLSTVVWNKDKNYLNRFRSMGIPVPDYEIIKSKTQQDLFNLLDSHGWHKVVIKPTISGGAYNTWIASIPLAVNQQAAFDSLLEEQDVIVQQFADEILINGEWSLIFFDKKFSHAVCKQAKEGEFRVQAQFGGLHHPVNPSSAVLDQVESILNSIEEPLLYARIDGYLNSRSVFYLMEIELIEPVLFFDSHPQACDNFYTALKNKF
jgi:hypothetical protein